MNLIFQSLIPLAFVIILGWFAGRRKIIDARHSSSLATYVMSFSFPCLLFAKTATTSLQHLFNYRFIAGLSLGLKLESTSSTVLGTVVALFSIAIIMRALGIGS